MKVRDLQTRRDAIAAEMRSIHDSPAGDNGDLSDAQETRFAELRAEIESIEKRIERQTAIDAAERRMAGAPVNGGDADFARELRSYSVVRAIAGAAGLPVDDGREREIASELARREGRAFDGVAVPLAALAPERRTVSATDPVAGPGGNLIGVDRAPEVIDRLRANMVTGPLGVRMLTGLRGDLDIGRLDKSVVAGWFADGAQIGETDPEFSKITFKPKHLGARTAFSRSMLIQSSPEVEGVLRADLAAVLAEQLDKAVLVGAGGDAPTGIVNQVGITALETAGIGAITHDDVIEAMASVTEADAVPSGFAMHPGVAKVLRKLRDSEGRTLDVISGVGRSAVMEGLPVATTTSLPAFANGAVALVAGDFADAMIGLWGTLEILVNPYAEAQYSRGAVAVRAILSADVQVRRAKSFAKLTVKAA